MEKLKRLRYFYEKNIQNKIEKWKKLKNIIYHNKQYDIKKYEVNNWLKYIKIHSRKFFKNDLFISFNFYLLK